MLVPKLNVTPDRIQGCAPLLVRMLTLFSFSRCVAVNRRLRHVIIESRHLWLWRRTRVVSFDRIARIEYRAQAVPALSPWRYLSLSESGHSDSALFFISLVLENDGGEFLLFTVWERQPRERDWLDRLAGVPREAPRIGDESAGRIVALLRDYLDVPVGH